MPSQNDSQGATLLSQGMSTINQNTSNNLFNKCIDLNSYKENLERTQLTNKNKITSKLSGITNSKQTISNFISKSN